jgi:2-phosphoglycerate kinase
MSPARRPVVRVRSGYGLPYSKGLMAQSLMATGLAPERSFGLAERIEERLLTGGPGEVEVEELRAVAEEVVAAQESDQVLARFRQWWNIRNLERPLIVLLSGVTGVGKSTVATQLAGRLGFVHVIATDQVRQVVRAFFTHEFLPAVHHSSFDVARALSELPQDDEGTIAGFLRQVHDIAPGVDALVERAISDRTPLVLEGVHLLPELPSPALCAEATTVRALIAARDPEVHRRHFYARGAQTMRAPERYLDALDRIRVLQEYLIGRAEAAGIPVIDAGSMELTLRRVLEVVLDAVGDSSRGSAASPTAKLSPIAVEQAEGRGT